MPISGKFSFGDEGGNGVALAAVTNIQVLAASGRVYVKWTDPEDLVVAGSTLAAWGGTKLIRKAGSAPISRRDGVQILDSKERNAYQDSYFCDSGLTDGVTYYYKFYPYTVNGTYTDSDDDAFDKTPAAMPVGNVSNIVTAAAGNGKVSIRWNDPAITEVVDGATLATWGKTVVVVKEGDYATDPEDADAVYRQAITTHNQYSFNYLIVTGLTNGTTYYVSFFPVSTEGVVNTNIVNRATGVPNRTVIKRLPIQVNTLIYNGKPQSPSWMQFGGNLTIGNQTAGTNAGTYVAQFTPDDDHCWADGSTGPKDVTWTIGKATGTLTTSVNSVTLNKITTSATFTIDGNYDGVVTVQSSDTSIVTASISGNTVTVRSVNNTTGNAIITVKCGVGTNYTTPVDRTVSVTAKFATIYGVEWDGTSTTKLSRTDASAGFIDPVPAVNNGTGSSPFDTLQPWAGMVRVTDAEAGELVAIPKFWYKFTKSGNTLKLQIADGPVGGFFTSPAHADRGDGKGERDIVYVGRYHCHMSNYKSQTGGKPKEDITRSAARTAIHNLGATIWQFDLAMRQTIQMLYLVEFADWDSQSKIGYGCGNGNEVENMGATDGMNYHTGTKQSARTIYGVGVQYRWIEGLWDNVYDWMDGCYNNNDGLNVILNPNNFNDSTNGMLVGTPSHDYPTAMDAAIVGSTQWIYPTVAGGSAKTYITDKWYFNGSMECLVCGGCALNHSLEQGLFFVLYNWTSGTSPGLGCRLQKLP